MVVLVLNRFWIEAKKTAALTDVQVQKCLEVGLSCKTATIQNTSIFRAEQHLKGVICKCKTINTCER